MMKKNKWIIITSINEPSEAIRKYAAMSGWNLVVVGDVSSPNSWLSTSLNLKYISIKDQRASSYQLARLIPEKHYTRKMFGYLYAIENGAEYIVDTDDDNIPNKNWESQWSTESSDQIELVTGSWVNTYKLYGENDVWPRGFPLNLIQHNPLLTSSFEALGDRQLGIVQGLSDNDPDVDAIFRLTNNRQINFKKRLDRLVLDSNSFTPINSQNTLFISEFFPLLFLPTTSTFRSTDIIRGIVAQPILWNASSYLGISNAGVVQERNAHNYLSDFKSEIPIYLDIERIAEIAQSSVDPSSTVSENLLRCYEALVNDRLIHNSELEIVKAWISDLEVLMKVKV